MYRCDRQNTRPATGCRDGHAGSCDDDRCDSRGDDRIILHADMNCFYAAVECFRRPELRSRPVVVGGHEELRHGIVLAKNLLAKAAGIKTGDTLWTARRKCPGLVTLPPDYRLYMRYSREARAIYYDYTDRVEPFGPDEAWLDVTGSAGLFGGHAYAGRMIAREISERIKAELGVTVSIGVSWNKIFAKFGSDYKKPDAITPITRENYRDLVWRAPAGDLLYVGRATRRKLARAGILTIGDIATAPAGMLRGMLGKMGSILHGFARGEDATPVRVLDADSSTVDYAVKSVGNGLTAPHDLHDAREVRLLLYLLAESVAQRLRELRLRARGIAVTVRNGDLEWYERQAQLRLPTLLTGELADGAWNLVAANEGFDSDPDRRLQGTRAIRSLGLRAINLQPMSVATQTDLFCDEERRIRTERLEFVVDQARRRFGNTSLRRACELGDAQMSNVDIKRDNVVHPVGFFQS
ncbi:MAG: DNA polymerase IV [Actinomycetes bacterium]|jgi:DNA polymerase-4|nr:DNA polymerase IV [Actinomycetes bacterium]